jgi:hypothetical protein
MTTTQTFMVEITDVTGQFPVNPQKIQNELEKMLPTSHHVLVMERRRGGMKNEWDVSCVNGDMCSSCPIIFTEQCILKGNEQLTKFKTTEELAKYRLGLKRQLQEKKIPFDVREPTVLLEKKVKGCE